MTRPSSAPSSLWATTSGSRLWPKASNAHSRRAPCAPISAMRRRDSCSRARCPLATYRVWSPNRYPVSGFDIQLVARLNVECRIPGINVGQRPVHPEVSRAVDIRHHLLAQCAIAIFGAPHLGPRDEEALIAAEPVDDRRRL